MNIARKYLLLLSIIISYSFCYGDSPPSWEAYKTISENGEYFCWVDFNDNDTSKYGWERKWILKVYNKDSVLFWQKEYQPLGYSEGLLSNDGKKFVYVEYWYFPSFAVKITSKDNKDIVIKGSDFNIPEKFLIETASHRLWLSDYDYYSTHLEDDTLTIITIDKKVWIIDTKTGVMELSEKDFWGFLRDDNFWIWFSIVCSAFVVGSINAIKTIGNVRKRRLFLKIRNRKKHEILFLVLVFSFICCQNTDNETIPEEEVKENPYLGEWYAVKRIIPFGAILKIDSNNIFTYEGGACLHHFNSQGSWTLSDDTLILNSFEPDGCRYLDTFGINCIIVNVSDTLHKYSVPVSIEGCKPDIYENYVIFNQEKLVIEDSILIHIQKPNNSCPIEKDKFTRTKR